jgi:hypothetical protein
LTGNPLAGLQDSVGRFIDGDHNDQAGGDAVAVLCHKMVTLNALALNRSKGGPDVRVTAIDLALNQMIV